jgi:glycosyltransferase involved in cell wall biosynthesis
MKLSVIMPVYNEINTIQGLIGLVRAVDVPKHIITG